MKYASTILIVIATLAFSSLALAQDDAQPSEDPTVVDSAHYRVVFENDQVRVLRVTYGPHEKSVMHYHPAGVAVFLTDFTGTFTLPDGIVALDDGQPVEFEFRAGEAIWAEAGSHLPENLRDEPLEVILVELKMPED